MTIKDVCARCDISQDTLRYYERVGVIPQVHRTAGGIRNYQEVDIEWVNNAICMRNAGMSVESIIEYVRLYQLGDETFKERLALLSSEREGLVEQKEKLEKTIQLLNYKISRYKVAVETGVLEWDEAQDTE